MANTTKLILPLIAAEQAQKHVPVNEALRKLDSIVQLAVKDRDLTAPPDAASDGDIYIPASGATGAWSAWDWNLAVFSDGAWIKLPPRTGWCAWIEDESSLCVWTGGAWLAVADTSVSRFEGGRLQTNNPFFTHSVVNVKGKALTGNGDGYFCFTVTDTNANNTAKGGAVLTCAPFANANKPFVAIGPYASSSQHSVFYGGGGWDVPEATHHSFYTGPYQPTLNNGSTIAFQITPTTLVSYREFRPATDNAHSLGSAAFKWSVVYSNTGTINTSDARLKEDVQHLQLGISFINALQPVSYRWKIGGHEMETEWVDDPAGKNVGKVAIDVARPKAGSRTHYGLLAQQVKASMDAQGIDDFAGWTLADPADAESEQGLRYDQFIPILIRAVQELSARIEELER